MSNAIEHQLVYGEIIYEGQLRFLIRSHQIGGKEFYLVDLEEFSGSGQCSCPYFDFNIRPHLKKGGAIRPFTPQAFCKHIRQARDLIANSTIKNMIKQYGK